jgi:triphosphoribosyl-dephospho-CoA synthetase
MVYNSIDNSMITSTSVSTGQIATDPEFQLFLKSNGWSTQGKNTAQGILFYNASSNAAICLSSEGGACTRISVISLAHPDNQSLAQTICSAIGPARGFLNNVCIRYKDYDPFENMNDIREINR